MSGLGIEFTTEGVTEVAAMFQHAEVRAGNMQTPLRKSSDLMLKTFDMNFDSQGRVFGAPWKKRQTEPSDGHPLMFDTGQLKHGFDSRVGNDYVELFNHTPYFKYHQSKKARSTNLPRRLMMKIDNVRRTQIIKYFQEYIMENR